MAGMSFVTYLGKTVLQIDIGDSKTPADAIEVYETVYTFLSKYRKDQRLYGILVLGDRPLAKEVVEYIIPRLQETRKKLTKLAIVLGDPEQDTFMRAFITTLKLKDTRVFSEYPKALNWLAE